MTAKNSAFLRPLRTVALLASALVVLGFALFAIDQSSSASTQQQAKVNDVSATAPRRPTSPHTGVRRAIDRADDVLLSPFKGLAGSEIWVAHGVPALLALLLYGAGLAYLARWVEVRS